MKEVYERNGIKEIICCFLFKNYFFVQKKYRKINKFQRNSNKKLEFFKEIKNSINIYHSFRFLFTNSNHF